VYDGYTHHPLTRHWQCAAEELGEDVPHYTIGLFTAMGCEGIKKICIKEKEICIPQMKVSI